MVMTPIRVAIATTTSLLILAAGGPGRAATGLAQASPQTAELQRQQAALLYNQGDLDGAAALLEPSLDAYLQGTDPNQIQQTASFLGLVYGELGNQAAASGNLAAALDYYQRQIRALETGFNSFAQAQALIVAGGIARDLGQSRLAQDYLSTGLAIAQDLGSPELVQQAEQLLAP